MDTLNIARNFFILIDNVCGLTEFDRITSYNKAVPVHKYIIFLGKLTAKLFECVKDMSGSDSNPVERNGILFLFIRPVDDAFDEEAIEQVEEALDNMCKHVDRHYTYTAQNTKEDDFDDDSDRGGGPVYVDRYGGLRTYSSTIPIF